MTTMVSNQVIQDIVGSRPQLSSCQSNIYLEQYAQAVYIQQISQNAGISGSSGVFIYCILSHF